MASRTGRSGAFAAHDFGELGSGHARHRLIGHHQIERLSSLDDRQRLFGGIGLDRRVSEIFEHIDGAHCNERVVVDHQNDRGADGLCLRRGAAGFVQRPRSTPATETSRSCPFLFGARKVERAAELDGEPVHHRQTEAGALAERL